MNIKFTVKVCAFLYYYKHESKYNKIPCFIEKDPKTTNKIYSISKQNLWFSTNKYLQLLLFPKLYV
jgi:hypothetical protein